MTLTLTKRPRITTSDLTRRRHFRTPDGRAEIVEVRWFHPLAYGVYWLVICDRCVIDRRRTRKAAEKALAARINPPKIRSTKR